MGVEIDIDGDLACAERLLRITYPGRKIRAFLVRADALVPARTFEVEDDGSSGTSLKKADAFDVREFGQDSTGESPVSVAVMLPGPERLERRGEDDEEPRNIGPAVRTIIAFSPMLFEKLKFALDRHYESRLPAKRAPGVPEEDLAHPISAAVAQAFRNEGASKRPAILIGFHWLDHGGAEKLAFDTVEWALAAGLRVIVVASHNVQHRLAGKLPDHPDVVFERMDRFVPRTRTRDFLRNLVLCENVHAIHIHHCHPLFDALPAIRAVAPDVHVISSTHITEYKGGGYVSLSARFGDYIDTQHVISHQLSDVFREKFGLGDRTLLGRILEHDETRGEQIHFEPSLANRPLKIIFVGRMTYQKRPVLMAMMMRALHNWAQERRVRLSFEIIGEGPYLPAFKSLLNRYDLNRITTLHPAHSDVPAIMKRSDIMILPSANEGLALVCYEAVKAGVLPISSDVGAQSELVPPDLLLDRDPAKALRSVVAIVDRLVNDAPFYQRAVNGLGSRYEAVISDPTAHDVLSKIYRRVATSGDNNND